MKVIIYIYIYKVIVVTYAKRKYCSVKLHNFMTLFAVWFDST